MTSPVLWKPAPNLIHLLKAQIDTLKQTQSIKNTDNQIDSLKERLDPFLKTVEANPPMIKFLVRWLGKKDLRENGSLSPCLIAEHLLKTENWQEKLPELQDRMTYLIEQFLKQSSQIVEQPAHFKRLRIEELDRLLCKSYHGVRSLLSSISELSSINENSENINIIVKDLQTESLHYLVSASKESLIVTQNPHAHHLPFGEYIDNEPHYYRGEGGAIIDRVIQRLIEQYPWLSETNINLIRNDRYSDLIITFCSLFNYKINNKSMPTEYLELGDISKIQEIPDSVLLIDLSENIQEVSNKANNNNLFPGNPLKFIYKNLCEMLVQRFSFGMKHAIILGTVLNFQDQDFYFFYSEDQKLLETFNAAFKSFRGKQGAYPEIMRLKRILLNLDYQIETNFLETYPVPQRKYLEDYLSKITPVWKQEFSENDVYESRQKLLVYISEEVNRKHNEIVLFYFRFFKDLLENIPVEFVVENPKIYEIVTKRYTKIHKLFMQASQISSSEALLKFQLIFEHTQILLIFFTLKKTKTLSKLINDIEPKVKETIEKNSYTHTSGISCFASIVKAFSTLPKLSKDKPSAIFERDSYYELTEPEGCVGNCLQKHFECQSISLANGFVKDLENIDLLFTDYKRPNRVVRKSVKTIDVVGITKEILQKRKKPNPFLLVLDCATSLFIHEEVEDDIHKLSCYIQDGSLILILTNSFAKYVPCGVSEKFPGGLIQIYSSKTNSQAQQYSKQLCESFANSSAQDIFSPEADRTFSLLFQHCRHHMVVYLKIIQENTDFVYNSLQKLVIEDQEKWKYPIQVAHKSPLIPMIGFHFNYLNEKLLGTNASESTLNLIVLLMQYHLFAKFSEKNLPITLKSSFGFNIPNLNECWSALRFTIGLEKEHLDSYVETIFKVNQNLIDLLKNEGSCKELSAKILAFAKKQDFSHHLYQVHARIQMPAQKGFESLVNFIEENLDGLEGL